jgi:hypothetical protein
VAGAKALIDAAIEHPFQSPSKERPPFGDLALAPLLEAQVEIAAAGNDVETARRASGALRRIADEYRSAWLIASALLAEARTALLTGELDLAVAASSEAASRWADVGAPYETAVARMVLAESHARSGREATAQLERQAAAAAFEAFGAHGQALQARSLHQAAVPADPPAAHVGQETATFRLDGDTRTITFAASTVVVRDLKGFRYLARLLAEPTREFHVLDLVAVEQGTLPTGAPAAVGDVDTELGVRHGAMDLPVLDEKAREAYRRRLSEVDDDIEDARRCNDPARAELAERDREYLIAELSRAVGLGGRLRTIGSDAERARMAVARTLRYAIDRLAEHHAPAAAHLENSVRTGTYCSYRPDPLSRVRWSV